MVFNFHVSITNYSLSLISMFLQAPARSVKLDLLSGSSGWLVEVHAGTTFPQGQEMDELNFSEHFEERPCFGRLYQTQELVQTLS
jgi:hypothetical protein